MPSENADANALLDWTRKKTSKIPGLNHQHSFLSPRSCLSNYRPNVCARSSRPNADGDENLGTEENHFFGVVGCKKAVLRLNSFFRSSRKKRVSYMKCENFLP